MVISQILSEYFHLTFFEKNFKKPHFFVIIVCLLLAEILQYLNLKEKTFVHVRPQADKDLEKRV
jgi:hypothetical protein